MASLGEKTVFIKHQVHPRGAGQVGVSFAGHFRKGGT